MAGTRHKGIWYMAVTNDRMETPLFLTPFAREMADYLGVTPNYLHSYLSRRKSSDQESIHDMRVVTFTDAQLNA